MIRTVDGHNSALLKAQARAARDVRAERGESSRTGASRLFGGAMRSVGRERDNRRSERDDRSGKRYVNEKEFDRSRQRDNRSDRMSKADRDEVDLDYKPGYRYRSDDVDGRDRHDHRNSQNSRRSRVDTSGIEPRNSLESSREKHSRHMDRPKSPRRHASYSDQEGAPLSELYIKAKPTHPVYHSASPPASDPPLPLFSTTPAPPPVSKMDKYFNREYDPRLDLGQVPKEGFIGEVGWDNMLAILKERGKKRRHHSPTLSEDPFDIPVTTAIRASSPRRLDRVQKEKKKMRWGSDESEQERERAKRKEKRRKEKQREKDLNLTTMADLGGGETMFDMAYIKKGKIREWDVGK